uniref:PLDc N-terminal domain-containing protein n=1 Tax=Myxococcus sp. CA018 TaxID=2651864 RepID=UPI001969B817
MHLFDIPAWLEVAWPHVVAALTVLISVVASAHAVLHKRDVRAAVGWVGLAWLVPVLGGVLYVLLGINRIRRRARSLMLKQEHGRFPPLFQVAPMKAEMVSGPHPEAAPLALSLI